MMQPGDEQRTEELYQEAVERREAAPIPLNAVEPEVQAGVVALLEEVLEMAKSGEVDGIALAATRRNRLTSTAFDAGPRDASVLYMAVGQLGKLILDAAETVDEGGGGDLSG